VCIGWNIKEIIEATCTAQQWGKKYNNDDDDDDNNNNNNKCMPIDVAI